MSFEFPIDSLILCCLLRWHCCDCLQES